jgi:hypothetical protein
MPNRLWVIAYNEFNREYTKMRLLDWLDFKYCAMEDIQKYTHQIGLYETELEADNAMINLLNK